MYTVPSTAIRVECMLFSGSLGGGRTPEPYYTILRFLHPAGAFLAFAAAPIVLLATKGARRHVIAGRVFVVGMLLGMTAGVLLAGIRSPDPPVWGLLYLGLLGFFFTITGYLAPRISRGSRVAYRWDRVLTIVGILASLALIADDLPRTTLQSPVREGMASGIFGLWVAVAHARWKGPVDPSRWRVEHFTSFLGAYTVIWWFIFGLYIRALPEAPRVLIPTLMGVVAIFWARHRFLPRFRSADPVSALL
jgi:xanthosine utilization system XapX-like protein